MVEHKVFAEGMVKDIREHFSPGYADVECAVVEQRKNNGQMCVGISFTKPGQPVSPIIYMEPFYEKVRCGEPLESIVQEIARSAEESMETGIPDCYSHIGKYDRVKGYLGVRLVNTKANRGGTGPYSAQGAGGSVADTGNTVSPAGCGWVREHKGNGRNKERMGDWRRAVV